MQRFFLWILPFFLEKNQICTKRSVENPPKISLHSNWPRWQMKNNGYSHHFLERLNLIIGLVLALDYIILELKVTMTWNTFFLDLVKNGVDSAKHIIFIWVTNISDNTSQNHKFLLKVCCLFGSNNTKGSL